MCTMSGDFAQRAGFTCAPRPNPPMRDMRMSLKDRIKGRVEAFDRWARPKFVTGTTRSKWRGWAYEFLLFGLKQAWACLFGGLMLALLLGTHLFWPAHAPIARYDFLVIASVCVQALL